jgi:hypothetical protein
VLQIEEAIPRFRSLVRAIGVEHVSTVLDRTARCRRPLADGMRG